MTESTVWESVHRALSDDWPVDLTSLQPPTSADWTLAPDALRFLAHLILRLSPRHILEFGSGISTLLMAREGARLTEPPFITSIDHDPQFVLRSASDPNVQVVVANLVARDFAGDLLPAYLFDQALIAKRPPVDLVIVDGPPACLGGRGGTLFQAMEFARPGTLLLLDDADRQEERAVLQHWNDVLQDAIEIIHLPGFAKGLAAVMIHQPVMPSEFWTHRVALTGIDLDRFVPGDDTVLLIDGDSLHAHLSEGRKLIPFLEHQGEYGGVPASSSQAIRELQRLRHAGASYVAVAWPSFWWFDSYPDFFEWLNARYRCILRNSRLILFDLRADDQNLLT